MATRFALLVIWAVACQECYGQANLDRTSAILQDMQQKLTDPQIGPVLGLLVNGADSILSDPEATEAYKTTLDESLKLVAKSDVVELIDYALLSFTTAFQEDYVRNIVEKGIQVTNAFLEDSESKEVIHSGIQIAYEFITDKGFMKLTRQLLKSLQHVLTNEQCRRSILGFLQVLTQTIQDPESLAMIQTSIRAMSEILSDPHARGSITKGVTMVQSLTSVVGSSNARA
ncbi:hypothetical protein M8J76_010264 [Diaphorina citri]|nr:hypothetical protein M8J75_008375 [Diaphorina citri]KAI5741085.1 hypothetical protein M8J76_010264 [Diaphorina citri]